ncbi:Hypothetical predicted protein [Pelobates cultripes]|uniref:Transmembrane protein 139 n=1 Tax=Pelobates cultripes TaxID=61616 RepID=A0AAD1TFX1_PELCU|nr:Hypothetical predicted protein [Pelobates cultripes]
MASTNVKKGVHRVTLTLGMILLLIGVVMLSVSDRVFILGVCFMGVGSLLVLGYLLITFSHCLRKPARSEDSERQTEIETRNRAQAQTEIDPRQFDAPPYEEVIVHGSSTVWTVTLGPGTEAEPPPYSAVPHGIGGVRLHPPTLLRISSDIHEIKNFSVIYGQKWPEPLTPPPLYSETTFDDVFEPSP